MTNEESAHIEEVARALSDFRFTHEGRWLQMKDEFWDKHRDECRAYVKVVLKEHEARTATSPDTVKP